VSDRRNALGQPIGEELPGWTSCERPPRAELKGRLCRLEPLRAAEHARGLHEAYAADTESRNWTYLPYGPFASAEEYGAVIETIEDGDDVFFAIVDLADDQPTGVASLLRAEPQMGVIEVGHLNFAPRLQGTAAATEAMYLMMCLAFDDLGYRRYEWKCDSLNGPSRAAAERLGFVYEGTFRQAVMYKDRNRDTAWFSITDKEWPDVKAAFDVWLDPANFDENGKQRRRLADIRQEK
jgi:RimJ/RimL family protein N-acetyltransferase